MFKKIYKFIRNDIGKACEEFKYKVSNFSTIEAKKLEDTKNYHLARAANK